MNKIYKYFSINLYKFILNARSIEKNSGDWWKSRDWICTVQVTHFRKWVLRIYGI